MSASATEILAGALQDYDRAIVIGQKTYGKWSVQEPFILSDESMMKITIAKWFTPKDRWIDEKWIEPDVWIELTDDDYINIYDRQLEWAKVILSDIVSKQIDIVDYKKDKESIDILLQNTQIYQ
jgi:carboxyl-terminal processing protease